MLVSLTGTYGDGATVVPHNRWSRGEACQIIGRLLLAEPPYKMIRRPDVKGHSFSSVEFFFGGTGAFFERTCRMDDRKAIRLVLLAAAFLLISTGVTAARVVRIWSYQELLEKSDLVAIATPTATNDTKEHIDLPGFVGQRVIGVQTRFAVSAVLKGDRTLRGFVFHHYRPDPHGVMVPNGPSFVHFELAEKPTLIQRTFILFLVREADGRYAPVVGQADPGLGVKELQGFGR